jgi:hypothetical protein
VKKPDLDKMLTRLDAASTSFRVITERRAIEEQKRGFCTDRTDAAYHKKRDAYLNAVTDLRAAIAQVQP